jgi:glutamate/tyrosine decarboxylase-like PLP-dependent enzyme
LLEEAVGGLESWEATWPDAGTPEVAAASSDAIQALVQRLKDNYPFFHPLYAGQMLKPPHPVAWVAYALTALINPNNHALDGGPATAAMEVEAVAQLARMLGYPPDRGSHLGHLTSSGTIANLEALWVARESAPGKSIAYCENAHYTHPRMCEVLGVRGESVRCDAAGRMDVNALEDVLKRGIVGTVVATAGTTGLGAIDAVHEILPLAARYGARVHVDAAYGGFFALLARRVPPLVAPEPYAALPAADSIVVDPHKHGLQPYGCGCVLFKDPSVGRFYKHDSPYTYFTSRDLHLGEISLECSRAGASAAALWATLQAIPLEPDAGLGEMLACGRRAATRWAEEIKRSDCLRLVAEPQTDIVVFAPVASRRRMKASEISQWAEQLFDRAMEPGEHNVYLAKYRMERRLLKAWHDIDWDEGSATVLRSVLMKPEHEEWLPLIHRSVSQLARSIAGAPRA